MMAPKRDGGWAGGGGQRPPPPEFKQNGSRQPSYCKHGDDMIFAASMDGLKGGLKGG